MIKKNQEHKNTTKKKNIVEIISDEEQDEEIQIRKKTKYSISSASKKDKHTRHEEG
jgi:hypothetical protein